MQTAKPKADGGPQSTLLRQHSPLSSPARQVDILESTNNALPTFNQSLTRHQASPLCAAGIEVLQVNLGKLCNQMCRHCHVGAGPDRREVMSRETIDQCLDVLRRHHIPILDITGGAPEMNPHFRYLVRNSTPGVPTSARAFFAYPLETKRFALRANCSSNSGVLTKRHTTAKIIC